MTLPTIPMSTEVWNAHPVAEQLHMLAEGIRQIAPLVREHGGWANGDPSARWEVEPCPNILDEPLVDGTTLRELLCD